MRLILEGSIEPLQRRTVTNSRCLISILVAAGLSGTSPVARAEDKKDEVKGTLTLGDKTYKLQNAAAFETKCGDKKRTAMGSGVLFGDSLTIQYGGANTIPVTGDWASQGHTGIGMIDPSTWIWKPRDSASAGAPDITFQYGPAGDKAVLGDWDGDGDTGIVNPGNGMWYRRQTPSASCSAS
jgi:hypothetical protein